MTKFFERLRRGWRDRNVISHGLTLGELPENTALFMCEGVTSGDRKIAYVDYSSDGPQAICHLNHSTGECGPKLVLLRDLYKIEPELDFLKDLENGSYAQKIGDQWNIGRLEEE